MSDIVERLRKIKGTQLTPYENQLQDEAADHIEALERKLEERDQLLEWISDQIAFAVQGDCENGVKWLNERAAASYLKDAPKLAKAISDIQDKILEIDND